ncbi:hypothetical protein D3C86_1808280 [compost metagenome]
MLILCPYIGKVDAPASGNDGTVVKIFESEVQRKAGGRKNAQLPLLHTSGYGLKACALRQLVLAATVFIIIRNTRPFANFGRKA